MKSALTNSKACALATEFALKRANLGDGSSVVSIRRKTAASYDLVCDVRSPDGSAEKEVIVTNRSLLLALAKLSKDENQKLTGDLRQLRG